MNEYKYSIPHAVTVAETSCHLLVQLITLSHDRYEAAIPMIQASYIKSQSVQQRLQLKSATQRRGHLYAGVQRLPKQFFQEGEGRSSFANL